MDIVTTLKKKDGFVSLGGADDSMIERAEKRLNLVFCQDYRTYVAQFGAASYYGHELTGVTNAPALDVVRITEMEKESSESIPQDWYVIERTDIDGIVFWQDARTGKIFRTAPKTMPVEMCDSLTSYVRFH